VTAESLASPRLGLAFASMLLVGGFSNAFPVFVPPLLGEFGGSRGATAAAMSIFWLGSAALGPVAGRLIDRADPRLVVVTGLFAAAAGIGAGALAPSLGTFSLLVGVGAGIGSGLTGFVTQAAVIAETYRARRGFATGLAFSGSMVGYALATPAHWAITTFGWRWTLAAWAVALVALVPPVLRYYPRRLGARADVATAPKEGVARVVRSVPFWALVVMFTAPPCISYLLTFHHVLYFAARGFTAGEAATMLLVGGVLSTAGRALAGLASDRLGASTAGVVSWMLSLAGTLSLVGFEVVGVPALAYAYLFFVFLPMGSRATIVSLLAARIAPPGRYGAVFGLLTIGNSAGAALGPFLSGTIYDLTASYLLIYLVAAGATVTAIGALVVFVWATNARAPQ
jgi:MFS family permease